MGRTCQRLEARVRGDAGGVEASLTAGHTAILCAILRPRVGLWRRVLGEAAPEPLRAQLTHILLVLPH